MSRPRQRMVLPQVASDVRLQPLAKRATYEALMMVAEDSGCFLWNPRQIRGAALPLETDATDGQVEQWMLELEHDDLIWRYEAEGSECGFLPEFPEWQRSLTRRNQPERVPLPPGILFASMTTANRFGSCTYQWPRSKRAMLSPAAWQTTQTAAGGRNKRFRDPEELFADAHT